MLSTLPGIRVTFVSRNCEHASRGPRPVSDLGPEGQVMAAPGAGPLTRARW